jgi:hypothetical protein
VFLPPTPVLIRSALPHGCQSAIVVRVEPSRFNFGCGKRVRQTIAFSRTLRSNDSVRKDLTSRGHHVACRTRISDTRQPPTVRSKRREQRRHGATTRTEATYCVARCSRPHGSWRCTRRHRLAGTAGPTASPSSRTSTRTARLRHAATRRAADAVTHGTAQRTHGAPRRRGTHRQATTLQRGGTGTPTTRPLIQTSWRRRSSARPTALHATPPVHNRYNRVGTPRAHELHAPNRC